MKAGDLLADRYRLLRTIGEGGMGAVWAAHHELIGRDVAIKVTGEKVSKRREIRERFLNEARAVGRVRHPNVIDVMDVGQLPDGRLYIVFELLEGRTLEAHLEKKGRLPPGDAAMILVEVCRGLEAAHAAGIVHRDLKPANIFLHRAPGGAIMIKLLDFGISKTIDEEGVSLSVTQTGVVMGTPQYMSVEQARGRDDIDLRADIWSAGAILYELATGRVAFDAANYNAVLDKIVHDEALPLLSSGVNEPELQAVVSCCLAKQRSQRYQSAKEMREALQALVPRLAVGAGGLKFVTSAGSNAGLAHADSTPPKRGDEPEASARHEPTLVAPPSDPRIGLPSSNAPPSEPSSSAAEEATSSPPVISVAPPPVRGRRRVAVTIASVVAAAGIAIAVSSVGSSARDATVSPTIAAVIEHPAPPVVAPAPPSAPEPAAAASAASSAARVEANARGASSPPGQPAGSASSRKPASAPKPRSVTRVESAGF